jgi:hypothetical protein
MWEVIEDADMMHVMPVDDERPHVVTDCWCQPTFDGICFIHHSFDGRERDASAGQRYFLVS